MTKEELFKKLKPIADDFKTSLASKQHTFNKHLDLIIECRNEGVASRWMVEAINSHMPDDQKINLGFFKSLLNRSKITRKKIGANHKTKEVNVKQAIPPTNIETTETNALIEDSDNELLDLYINECRSQAIAKRALEGGVPLETIREWKLSTTSALSQAVTGYIRDKEKSEKRNSKTNKE